MWKILQSEDDASINVHRKQGEGLLEARFVQRVPDYFIVYLSSHTGCNQTCRFCHLTATGQTSFEPVTTHGYLEQLEEVLHVVPESAKTASTVHINFMARGEPLLNPYLVRLPDTLYTGLSNGLAWYGYKNKKFLISTIMPEAFLAFKTKLSKVLTHPDSHLYYSLYSVDPEFRKKWLPRAMDPYKALDLIAEYQQETNKEVTLHWAFIEGENDSVEMLHRTMKAVVDRGIKAKFNLVRYNPYSNKQGKEVSEEKLQHLFNIVQGYLIGSRNKIVPRVGYDVKASCGMFLDPLYYY